ncbi:radical SAM/SPASM domain-containing protein [Embleya scabrispora]|uniref:radical SAM/SPASM domain-containing protein n=1 Tax=Embleya scabrispora TaxID=159449 RepID=UPI00037634D1|nr:radical SAM/SPASM domain-containing protein [Embleya scabrispora]MYS81342.1 radical SAM/SPASM domain-containing protein [Streptomyces sp. SID5474]
MVTIALAVRPPPTPRIRRITLELDTAHTPARHADDLTTKPNQATTKTTTDNWRSIITDAAQLGAESMQFAGAEPTAHPDFTDLLRHAIHAGHDIEVHTDLLYITREQWTLFTHERVRLATTWYSDDPAQHDAITDQLGGSHIRARARARANILTALGLHIPLRVELPTALPTRRTDAARAELALLGVREDRIGNTDFPPHRHIPHAPADPDDPNSWEHVVVQPNGDVTLSPVNRARIIGNIHRHTLTTLLAGDPP